MGTVAGTTTETFKLVGSSTAAALQLGQVFGSFRYLPCHLTAGAREASTTRIAQGCYDATTHLGYSEKVLYK